MNVFELNYLIDDTGFRTEFFFFRSIHNGTEYRKPNF